ncbi:MAG: efflux RND transporter periplasmic adaptor subunit [Acidobacteria bacterium]|nr:efflux RND transporter periplasmic adaptor subunit [Acidobacteriota bacterium]MBI3469952.1 efflux RND transporter periplasmic adaptor subunit [Candidatus Solibacter usitatus]
MKLKWKIILGLILLVTLGGGTFASISYSRRGIVEVQTGRVLRQDLASVVTASGEIKPRNYVNIGANAMGRITDILVNEGDRVKRGQMLAKLEAIQPQADVNAQRAALSSSQAESTAAEAGLKAQDENLVTLQAGVDRARAELERATLDFKRGEELFNAKLIAKQEYDQRKAAFDSQGAGVREAQARLIGARASREETAARLSAAQKRILQSQALLARLSDVLEKHYSVAPLDGMVTNLPVRVGETVVMGIQNTPGSLIMTIADMSLITAEVKVDETDIVNVKLDQKADITIDAMPGRTFKGHVIEIGNTAILRSTGLAASQSNISSQEAKDFKVVVALDNPPEEIRPGLSCTAKVTTATRQSVLTAPIQALTVRQRGDLEPEKKDSGGAQAAAKPNPAAEKARKEEIQGVFVIQGEKAEFRKVDSGITGATDIEILGGLKDGDEIITGSYKVIRTLRNAAKIKVNNKAPEKKES